jgi:uncharacterized Zn-binding protein involved in type VI secretion
MAKKFLTGLNLVVLDADPATGSEGELYFNSSASVAKIYQAGSWSVLGAGGGGGAITVSTTEPASPNVGDAWYKNDTGEFYVYDGTYWVEVNGVIASESFKTISVSGQSDVVADSNTDTLTLVAGTNVSITTNSTNDSITINADSKSTSSVYLVRNNTGSTILKGTLVSASGAEPSGRIDVEPFEAVGGINSELTVMGMATANISNGVNGEVISFGTLTGLDTRGNVASGIAVGDETWAAGDILFAHPTVAGKLTKVRPHHDLAVAFITVRHASTGQIAVRIVPGNNHLEWMHDVLISGSVQNGESLVWNSASGLWMNQLVSGGGGATTTISETAPATPSTGDSWYKQSTGSFFIYDGSYWVEVNGIIDGLTQDQVQDYASTLFTHSNHSNITATYDDVNGEIILTSSAAQDLTPYLTQSSASTTYAPLSGATFTGDIAVNGGDLTSSASTVNLFTNAIDKDINIGYASNLYTNTTGLFEGYLSYLGGNDQASYTTTTFNNDVKVAGPTGNLFAKYGFFDEITLVNALPYSIGGTGLTTLGTSGQVLAVNSGGSAIEWANSLSSDSDQLIIAAQVFG